MTSLRPGPPGSPRRNAVLLVAAASLGAFAMHAAGHGVLASPQHWSLHSWQALVTEHGAPTAALVVVRVLALAASLYLAGLGLLTILFARTRNHTLRRWLAAATPRLLRPALGVVGALSFATPAYAADPSTPPVMVLVTTTAPATTTPAPASPPPTMRRLAEALDRATSTPVAPLAPATAAPAPSSTAVPSAASTAVPTATPTGEAAWTVDRGDHFWHIAEATLYVRLGRAPDLQETDTYWRVLVDTNRPRLVDAHNPDLLFAGQEIILPPHR